MHAKAPRPKRKRIISKVWLLFAKQWLFLVLLIAVAITVIGVRSIQGKTAAISDPPSKQTIPETVVEVKPKDVVYELFGTLGGSGRVTFANLSSEPVEVELHSLPWEYKETTFIPGVTLSMVAQVEGGSLGCRITVDGRVLDEQFTNQPNAAISCTVLAA